MHAINRRLEVCVWALQGHIPKVDKSHGVFVWSKVSVRVRGLVAEVRCGEAVHDRVPIPENDARKPRHGSFPKE
jgi:hypothetical protein